MLKVPESTQEPGPAVGTRSRKPLRRLAAGALVLVLILASLAGGLAWQATHASVSLNILRNSLATSLRARLPANSTLTIGSTAFSYRGDQGFVIKAHDVDVALPRMGSVAIAELSVVTTASAVLARRIDFDSVAISGAEIDLVAPLGIQQGGSAADAARSAAKAFMAQVLEADNLIRGAGLENVAVRDAALRLTDERGIAGPALTISEGSWLPLGSERSKLWLQVVERNGAGWDLTLERQIGSEGGAAVNLKIEHLPLVTLAPDLADGDGDDAFHDASIGLQARMVSGKDGTFRGVRGVISSGSGPLSFTGIDRIEMTGAAFSFALPPTGDRLAIPGGEIRTRTGNVEFDADLEFDRSQNATLTGRIQRGSLPTIGNNESVELTGGEVLARIDLARMVLEIEQFRLAAAGGTLSATGQARFAGADPGIGFSLSLGEMPAAVARAFWPPFVAEKTRRWFDANVKSGTLGPATVKVALPRDHIGKRGRDRVLPEDALLGTLPFKDAEFSPATIFPPLREASGDIHFAQATATVLMETGLINVAGKGDLQAAGTILVVPELGKARPWGDLHLQLAGPASALAALSNVPPLSVAAKRGIKPEALTGGAQLSLDGRVPLFESDFSKLSPTFRLALTEFSSTAPISNRLISDADLVLDGAAQSFTVKGQGTLDGLQASVDLVLGSAAPGQTDVIVSLDDAARKRLGIELGGLVTGPVQASIKQSGEASQQIALDLAQARISLPSLGWEKGAGVAATATFVMAKTEEGTRITDLVLSGKGFGAKGEISIGPDGKVRELELAEFALRPGDQVSVTATSNRGGYDVTLRGVSMDARGLIRGISAGSGGRGSSADIFPLRISLDLQGVTGESGVVLSDIVGTATITANGLESVSLEGAAGRTQKFAWNVGKDGGARTVGLRASNGGALIRFLGIYRKVAEGELVLDYRGTIGGAGTGVMVMRDFRLLGETALAPAVERATRAAAGRPEARVAQDSGDLRFAQLRIPFRQDRWVIAIDDAALRGPMLGATASGTVNIPGKRMAISGTFIPAFGLNNIAGAIPIIGTILGGGRDEGLVGITYKLFGPIDGPKLAMNPISAIAPGIFRKIFEYR